MIEPTEPDPAELAAETLGRDLLSALLDELKAAPDCWEKMNAAQQDHAIDRLRRRVQSLVSQTLGIVFRGDYPACSATLSQVTFKDGIKAVLDIAKTAEHRHELADLVGSSVVVILADPTQYTEGMEEIRATAQADLFEGSRTGVLFPDAELDEDAGADPDPETGEIPAGQHPEDDGPTHEQVAELFQEPPEDGEDWEPDGPALEAALRAVGVDVDVPTVAEWSPTMKRSAYDWAKEIQHDPSTPRPQFLPSPNAGVLATA